MTDRTPGLGLGFGAALALHAALFATILIVRTAPPLPAPRMFRVNLTAAPQGEPAIGVVTTKAVAAPPKAAPPLPPAVARPNRKVPVPTVKPTTAPPPPAPRQVTTTAVPPTSVPKPATPLPVAGSAAGGTGADVLNQATTGVDFPYPAYLKGIANAIAAGFPSMQGSLSATVQFTIYRDGSVHDFKFVSRSGAYLFDRSAQGAVDRAGSTKAFGPLPADFHDDALTVFFTFSPPKPPSH